jgi:hypothetical protein
MATAAKSMAVTDFKDRLLHVWLDLQRARNDRITQVWIAQEMTRRGVSMTQGSVSSWFRGESLPRDLQTYVVLAQVLSFGPRGKRGWVDPGWLAFGEGTDAPAPEGSIGLWTAMQQPEES